MSLIDGLRRGILVFGFIIVSVFSLHGQTGEPEWRNWQSSDGSEIEAYLKEAGAETIVIVRRDGREFTVPLARFSEADQAYVRERIQQPQSSAEDYRSIDFRTAAAPEQHQIEGVEQVRLRSRDAAESGAVQAVLNFHGINYDSGLGERISARKANADVVIPPNDLAAALSGLPVETLAFTAPPPAVRDLRRSSEDLTILNAIRKAISLDLPVIIGYRPEIEEDTPEIVGVATGYDRRTLYAIEAEGARRAIPLDWRTLEESLLQAVVIFPTQAAETASANGAAPTPPPTEFLSQLSTLIRQNLNAGAAALTENLNAENLAATVTDVNRSDLRSQLGSTRSFAREGGIPQIRAVLHRGSVVIVPQEFDAGHGFALVYGDAGGAFAAVEFFPTGTFNRGQIAEADLARRWVTRDDRNYHLDLIEVAVPPPAAP